MAGLPKFEGATVAAGRLQLNGFGEDLNDVLRLGEKVYYLIEAEVIDIRHPRAKGVITRQAVGRIARQVRMDPAASIPNLDAEDERRHLAEIDAADKARGQTTIDDELEGRRRKDLDA